MSLLLLFAYPNPASVPISELVTTAPSASNGFAIQRPATTGEWRWVVELADPSDGFAAIWRDITGYYVGDRHQFGADTYKGDARARLVSVQLQIDDSDMLAPWGQDTSSIFGTDVRLDAGMLMRAGMVRIVSGVVEEWEPIWTGRVESWGDESGARGQVRRHVVNVVDTIADLANVPTIIPTNSTNWDTWFTSMLLPAANWPFGVDIYGDTTSAGLPLVETATAAIVLMDAGTDPLGLVWRSLRSGRMVIHPAPWDTTNVNRYTNPLLDVYPDGLRFSYSPDFTDIEYIADDDQESFGIERTVAGILNSFVVTMPADLGLTDTYAIDDPVSVSRYGVRPFTATWILSNPPVVDDLLTDRAFASSQALPLRTTLDLEGFWSALSIVDHLDPVTVVHATSDTGLVVTGTGVIRNIVEERTFRGEAGGDYALSWQSTVQIDLDATETSAALLPVEDLALVTTESPLLGGPSFAEFSWTNPVQPDITPTEVQMRMLSRSFIWFSEDYPGVGADGTVISELEAATAYTFQVRLVRRVNGLVTAASAIRQVRFTTPYRIYPHPVPDGTDTGGEVGEPPDFNPDDCVMEVELQEQTEIGGAWVTVDTFTGAELTDNGDGTWSLTTPIPNSFFNDGSMYRFRSREVCGGIDGDWTNGGGFDPPDDWTDPCTTPPALSDPPFDDASLLVYVPMICAPDTIKEAVSGLVAVHGPALGSIGSLLGGDPDQRALLAIADPVWSETPGGILAYGECPQIAGHVGDKTVTVKANVANAAYCVLFECGGMRLTVTPDGGGWKAGAYVAVVGGEEVCLSAATLALDTAYVLTATYEQETGTLTLYVDGALSNSVTFGEARNTVTALPIWRVGAPPESWMTDAALFGEATTPSYPNEVIYNYTGSNQTFVVPGGVTTVEVEYWGASSKDLVSGTGGTGGLGGYLLAHHTVTPGETLRVVVGGQNTGGIGTGVVGGFGGGGTSAGGGASLGAGGAGASYVSRSPYAFANRLGVAGGGGGGGAGYANGRANANGGNGNGNGNGTAGAAGVTSPSGGGAGTTSAGGAGGVGDNNWGAGNGAAGVLGIGGDSSMYHGGGGGGGIYGGGGGGGGLGPSAGGGGSGGVLDGGTVIASDIGIRTGDGLIKIRYS